VFGGGDVLCGQHGGRACILSLAQMCDMAYSRCGG